MTKDTSNRLGLKNFRGVIYALLGASFSALLGVCITKTEELTVERNFLAVNIFWYLVGLPLMRYQRSDYLAGKTLSVFFFLCLNGIFGFLANFLFCLALKHLPIGEALASSSIYGPISHLMACLFLKESFKPLDAIFLLSTVTGITFIAKPEFIFGGGSDAANRALGVVLGVGSSLTTAIVLFLPRKLKSDVVVSQTLFFISCFGILGLTINLSLMKNGWSIPCSSDIPWMIGGGVVLFLGWGFKDLALRVENVGPVAVVYSSQMAFGFLYDLVIFKVRPDLWALVGSILIFAACIGSGVRKCVTANKI